jgi:hypothetical protein
MMDKQRYERSLSKSISKPLMLGILFDEIMSNSELTEKQIWSEAKILYRVYLKHNKEDVTK